MKNIKRFLFILIFAGICVLLSTNTSNASGKKLNLKELKFDVKINTNGSMDVTETWDISINKTNTLYKTFEVDKSKYSNITNVTVKEVTNGNNKDFAQIYKEMYHVTKDSYYALTNSKGLFEIAWGVGMDNTSGTRKYEISYKVNGVIANNIDCSELYWQFVGKDFEINADKIKGTIKLPSLARSKEDIRVWGHTEDLNGEIYATDKDTVEFNVNDFNSGVYVEVRVAIPKDIQIFSTKKENKTLQDIINEETKWTEEANRRRELKNQIGIALGILAIVVAIVCDRFLIRNIKKNNKILNESEKLQPSNKYQYYRDIPNENRFPSEALLMVKESVRELYNAEIGYIFSAILLELNLKKYIEFIVCNGGKRSEDIIIKILNQNNNLPERQDEKYVYIFLLNASKNNSQITLKDLERYIKSHSSSVVTLKKNIDKCTEFDLIKENIVDAEEKKQKEKRFTITFLNTFGMFYAGILLIIGLFTSFFLVIAALLLLVPLIMGTIISVKISNKINVYTQIGVDEIEKWKGLERFMKDFSMMDRKELPEITIWEKYLVYATAFGMAEEVIKKLKLVYPEIVNDANYNSGIYMGNMVHTNFSSSLEHSVSSAMSSTYSSATGGGGGFSGGGGGGRRPEVEEAEDESLLLKFIWGNNNE